MTRSDFLSEKTLERVWNRLQNDELKFKEQIKIFLSQNPHKEERLREALEKADIPERAKYPHVVATCNVCGQDMMWHDQEDDWLCPICRGE